MAKLAAIWTKTSHKHQGQKRKWRAKNRTRRDHKLSSVTSHVFFIFWRNNKTRFYYQWNQIRYKQSIFVCVWRSFLLLFFCWSDFFAQLLTRTMTCCNQSNHNLCGRNPLLYLLSVWATVSCVLSSLQRPVQQLPWWEHPRTISSDWILTDWFLLKILLTQGASVLCCVGL